MIILSIYGWVGSDEKHQTFFFAISFGDFLECDFPCVGENFELKYKLLN